MKETTFAQRLAARRALRRTTQEEEAANLGVAVGTYRDWEQGRHVPLVVSQRAVLMDVEPGWRIDATDGSRCVYVGSGATYADVITVVRRQFDRPVRIYNGGRLAARVTI